MKITIIISEYPQDALPAIRVTHPNGSMTVADKSQPYTNVDIAPGETVSVLRTDDGIRIVPVAVPAPTQNAPVMDANGVVK